VHKHDAPIASRTFASEKFRVETVEQLGELAPADLEEAVAAAKAEGLSASGKSRLVKIWGALQTAAPPSPVPSPTTLPLTPPPPPDSSIIGLNGKYERVIGGDLLQGRIAAGFKVIGGTKLPVVFKLSRYKDALAREQKLLGEVAELKGSKVVVGCKDLVEWPDGGHALVLERGAHSLRHEIVANQGSCTLPRLVFMNLTLSPPACTSASCQSLLCSLSRTVVPHRRALEKLRERARRQQPASQLRQRGARCRIRPARP